MLAKPMQLKMRQFIRKIIYQNFSFWKMKKLTGCQYVCTSNAKQKKVCVADLNAFPFKGLKKYELKIITLRFTFSKQLFSQKSFMEVKTYVL